MRHMKIQRPLVPLFLALGLVVGSMALSFLAKSPAVWMAVSALHFPAGVLTFLVLPGEAFTKSGSPAVYLTVYSILAVLQWYLVFAGGMWVRRRLRRREEIS
jgi:hypothetical protein